MDWAAAKDQMIAMEQNRLEQNQPAASTRTYDSQLRKFYYLVVQEFGSRAQYIPKNCAKLSKPQKYALDIDPHSQF